MSLYYYLDVTLEFKDREIPNITPALYKNHIMQCMKKIFGEIGASVRVDILKYDPDALRSILRVPKDFYVKLHSTLTLCNTYEGKECAFIVHKTSPLLITLCCDSRNYTHE